MSGWRSSDSSAPGTITDAPTSPPMASSAMRTLSDMLDLGGNSPGAGRCSARRDGRGTGDNTVSAGRYHTLLGIDAVLGCGHRFRFPRPDRNPASAAKGLSPASPLAGGSNTAPGLRG